VGIGLRSVSRGPQRILPRGAHLELVIYNRCCPVKRPFRELFGNSPKERGANSDFAFNIGGTWKLSAHLNLLFAGGRDIVGNRHAMAYLGLQVLTK